jgi:hypothetical protein
MADEIIGAAASELLGGDDRPITFPGGLSGFANRGADAHTDQQGQLRSNRTFDQIAADHRDWMQQFDYARRRNGFDKSEPPEKYSDEARARRDADFRAAARADGYGELPEPMSPAELDHHTAHMLPVSVSASEYKFDVSGVSTAETSAATRSEMGEFAAEMGFLPGNGSSLLQRLIDNAKAIKGQPAEARAAWGAQAKADMIRRLGDNEAEFDRQLEVIQDGLRSVQGKGRDVAQHLANDVLIYDWYTFKTLYRQAASKESFFKSYPGKKQ